MLKIEVTEKSSTGEGDRVHEAGCERQRWCGGQHVGVGGELSRRKGWKLRLRMGAVCQDPLQRGLRDLLYRLLLNTDTMWNPLLCTHTYITLLLLLPAGIGLIRSAFCIKVVLQSDYSQGCNADRVCCLPLPPLASPPPTRRLVDEGFNPAYGARPLRRAIMRLIEDCLAERILCGDIKEGDVVIMDVDPDGAIAVLAGDKKMRQMMDATPAGIS